MIGFIIEGTIVIRMLLKRKALLGLIAVNLLAQAVAATSWVAGLKQIAVALGWVMMIIMGIKWITADAASDRADAKKGMIYIVIGLLVVAMSCNLLCLYCDAATASIPTANLCTSMTANYGCTSNTC